jgi:hypothetical protein
MRDAVAQQAIKCQIENDVRTLRKRKEGRQKLIETPTASLRLCQTANIHFASSTRKARSGLAISLALAERRDLGELSVFHETDNFLTAGSCPLGIARSHNFHSQEESAEREVESGE